MSLPPPSSPPNRRTFLLKTGLSLLSLPGLWVLRSLLKRQDELPELQEAVQVVPFTTASGVRFFGKFIVVADGKKIAVFSSRCPHLGCQIGRQEGDELVCPCHGSRFGVDGAVHRGPVAAALRPLRFELDPATASLRVHLEDV